MLLIDNQYFPTISFYYTLLNNTNINIVEYENFKKSTFRNRCIITGSNGPITLSVPLKSGRNQKSLFRSVEISYTEDWQKRHWRSLLACYSRSPFFEYYQLSLYGLFCLKEKFLFDYNLKVQEKLAFLFKVDLPTCLNMRPKPGDTFTDLRDSYTPQNFRDAKIPGEYVQVFGEKTGFIPNLSILDLICNLGPEALNYLKSEKI